MAEWVYGLHAVAALLQHKSQDVIEVWLQRDRQDQRIKQLCAMMEKSGLQPRWVTRQELDQKIPQGVHQGVVAKVVSSEVRDEGFLENLLDQLATPALLLVLDGVTDPHNLGACLRSADAAGVHAVVAPKDNSVGLTAVARKSASGAAETMPYIQVTNLARTLDWLKQRGVWLVGTSGEGQQSIYETDLKGALAIVMGAEGKGMRRLTRESCDYLAYIPMAGVVESLNVSVAAGICLFEAVRQRSGC